jgi:hypothetical protein
MSAAPNPAARLKRRRLPITCGAAHRRVSRPQPSSDRGSNAVGCRSRAARGVSPCQVTSPPQLSSEARRPSAADHLRRGASPCQPPPTQQRGANAVGCRSPASRRIAVSAAPNPAATKTRTSSAADHLRGAQRIAVSAAPNPAATEVRTPSAADHLRRAAYRRVSRTCQVTSHPTRQRGSNAVGCRPPAQRGASPCQPHQPGSEARTPSAADHLRGAAHRRVSRTQPGSEARTPSAAVHLCAVRRIAVSAAPNPAARLERRRLPTTCAARRIAVCCQPPPTQHRPRHERRRLPLTCGAAHRPEVWDCAPPSCAEMTARYNCNGVYYGPSLGPSRLGGTYPAHIE